MSDSEEESASGSIDIDIDTETETHSSGFSSSEGLSFSAPPTPTPGVTLNPDEILVQSLAAEGGKEGESVGAEGEEEIMGSYQTLSTESGGVHAQDICDGEGSLYGYKSLGYRTLLYYVINICTLFIPSLVFRWNPHLKVKLLCAPCPLSNADWVILTIHKDDVEAHHVCPVIFSDGDSLPDEFVTRVRRRLIHQDSKTHLFSNLTCDPITIHRFFIYRYQKYVWDNQTESFRRLNGLENTPCTKILDEFKGISDQKREQLRVIHGPNFIEVEVKSYLKLLVEEVLNPFYVFQILSVALWCFDEYVYYATCVVIISAISIAIALVETKRQSKMLRDMAQSSEMGKITIRTPNGVEESISSRDLVPGDVIVIPPEGFIMPCDAVLIFGSCIVNESMLTGESTPVQKSALTPVDEPFDPETHRRHTLFCGTQVIQTRYYQGNKVTCVVVKTGFSTVKGELIHSILFPKEIGFKFYADALRFVAMLFGLALIGMSYCVFLYVQRGTAWYVMLVRVLDVVTIVVPPALPAAMTVGTVYAQNRLRKKLIFCISPPRINFCGKLKLICFDKTGTLTEDGLDLWCVVPVSSTRATFAPEFQEPVAEPSELPEKSPLLSALASCHSLTYIHGKIVGDPLDLKMFASTGWELEEPVPGMDDISKFDLLTPTVVKKGGLEIGIIREFEFTPQLQRMSVIVRTLNSPEMILYSKGAPEKIRGLCIPSSIPENYDKVLDSFTVKGYRVLALGQRIVGHVKWHQIQRVSRDSVENDLEFSGFLVMQNSLKPATNAVIEELNAAAVRSVMVTGDNMLTALSVARECGIVPSCDKVLIVNVNEDNKIEFTLAAQHYEETEEEVSIAISTSTIQRQQTPIVNDPKFLRKSSIMTPPTTQTTSPDFVVTVIPTPSNNNEVGRELELVGPRRIRRLSSRSSDSSSADPAINFERLVPILSQTMGSNGKSFLTPDTILKLQDSNYHFVMTGRTWSLLEEVAAPSLVERIVAKGAVYARMSPENKAQLVERLQGLGYVVGMCGDGANDCSALKMAHVGISLSEAEASVAAPFTSKVPDISCVPNLIREGRCALVTSFGIFKYMALYSLVQFASVLLLYAHKTNLADTQFLYFDLGITTSIAIVMGRTEPYPRLVPQRPMGSLVSLQNVASLILQVIISAFVQVGAMQLLQREAWFSPVAPTNPNELITLCWETTTIFSVSGFQYLILALVFSKGPPFRKPFYTNGMFVFVYIILTVFTILLAAYPIDFLANFFHLMPVGGAETLNFRLILLALPLFNLIVSLALEGDFAVNWIKRLGRLVIKKREKSAYKIILKELEDDLSWPPVHPS